MYSAAPGTVINDNTGDTSIFAGELIKELRVPNLTAEDVFNHTRIGVSRATNNEQIPWVASSLVEEYSFGAGSKVATAPPAPVSRPTPAPPAPAPVAPRPTIAAPTPAPAPAPAPPPPPPVAAAPVRTPPPPTYVTPAPVPAPVATPPAAPAPSVQASARNDTAYKPGDAFRDCADCGEMVVVPAGFYNMGASAPFEGPVHKVTLANAFAVGRYEVTFDEWDRCFAEKGCKFRADDRGLGRGNRPVVNVSWLDAKEFVAWMSQKTGKVYRLPSEAEWEYVARAGSTTDFWWGRDVGAGQANCRECNSGGVLDTMAVGSFKPNPFGLFDTAGNAAEWVEDCWNDAYRGAPQDGTPWTAGQCNLRVLRGGAYDSQAKSVASPARFRYDYDVRYPANGFRVVRELR